MSDRADIVRVGLVGRGIGGSLSPRIHAGEAEALGMQLTYELFDLEAPRRGRGRDLAAVLDKAEAEGFAGLNVTYPFKQSVIPLLGALAPSAARLGAVNTVLFTARGRVGHCTDGWGFAENLRRGLPRADLGNVVLIGAGGAGAAAAYALLDMGAQRLAILDLEAERVGALVTRLAAVFGGARIATGGELAAELADADGVVNATPVGMAAHPGSPVPAGLLRAGLWVADVVYVPLETELLRAARTAGCRVLNGGGMAVYQAAHAFHLFTGLQPDAERMRSHFLAAL